MAAWWLIVVALVGMPDSDLKEGVEVSALIARLTAPRRSDRERAAERLVEIGDGARAALLKAVGSRDLELKARAASVLDSIEGRDLGRPKPITLDFRDKPVSEVVDAIAVRTGEGLVLQAGNDPQRGDPKITLIAEEKVAFWDAVERLGKVADVRPELNPNGMRNQWRMMGGFNNPGARRGRPATGREVVLVPSAGRPAPPMSRSGRFEVIVFNIHHQRDRTLGAAGGRRPIETSVDRFEVRLRLVPEPSLNIGKIGEVEGLEAIDERGQSLVPESTDFDPIEARRNGYSQANAFNSGEVTPTSIRLRYPDQPGATIRTLKGAFDVTVVGTRSDPVAASLVSKLGVPVRRDGINLIVHGMKPSGMPSVRSVELSLTRPGSVDLANAGGMFYRTVNVAPNTDQGWLEFIDAKGRQVDRVAVTPFGLAQGRRSIIQFNQPNGADPAVEVRYLAPTWTTLAVPFEFHDLPMP